MRLLPPSAPLPPLPSVYGPRAAREARGLSRKQVAVASGYTEDYVRKIESAFDRLNRMTPAERHVYLAAHPNALGGPGTAFNLARAAGISANVFYTFAPQAPKPASDTDRCAERPDAPTRGTSSRRGGSRKPSPASSRKKAAT